MSGRRFWFYFLSLCFLSLALLCCQADAKGSKKTRPVIKKPVIRMSAMRQELSQGKVRELPIGAASTGSKGGSHVR